MPLTRLPRVIGLLLAVMACWGHAQETEGCAEEVVRGRLQLPVSRSP